ncbi:substrate-binding domain-containing protein [Radicibacter daui]|uniref:substrate-binding domain-containing protein n=1 Tax=Radicibacter daui TaxID=3064829 RepID=UPI0040469C35
MKKTFALAALATLALAGTAEARDQIRIVGSSTVFPFSSAVAEQFGQKTSFPSPVVESTGTGGGMKLFCAGVGTEHPDLTGASRQIKKSEFADCQANGVTDIVQLRIGKDGIAFASSKSGPDLNVTRAQLFLALAKQVPVKGKLVDNPNKNWSDIDRGLPDEEIEVLGPPPTSGTRDAWVELVMTEGCKELDYFKSHSTDVCGAMREDGAFIEAGENDNLIVQKLEANPVAFGIFGFSFLDQNSDKLQGARIEGVAPTFDTITDGSYEASRPLFLYVKKAHVGVIPGISEYLSELTSENALGDYGYLVEKGLIPLPPEDRDTLRAAATALTPFSM